MKSPLPPPDTRPTSSASHRGVSLAVAGLLAVSCLGVGAVPGLAQDSRAQEDTPASAESTSVEAPGNSSVASSAEASVDSSSSAEEGDNTVPKREVVYARLGYTGAVNDVYVVNMLNPGQPETVVDYGSYQSVQNLTNGASITSDNGANTVDVSDKTLNYQGDLGAANLPWQIAIRYDLDGQLMDASDLGGADGRLTISVNTYHDPQVNSAYYDNYLLQVSITLPQASAASIEAPGAQVAMAGSDTQVTFMSMPGKDGSFMVSADVHDFEMPGINFAAVPLAMGFESPDTSELVSGFEELGDGVGELRDGSSQLASGANQLHSGIKQLSSGIGEFASGATRLADGITELGKGAEELSGGASGLASGTESLASGASEAADGANEMSTSIAELSNGAASLADGLAEYQASLRQQASQLQTGGQDVESLAGSAIASYSQAYSEAFASAFAVAYQSALAQSQDPQVALQTAVSSAAASAAQQEDVVATLNNLASDLVADAGGLAASQALSQAAEGISTPQNGVSLLDGVEGIAQGLSALSDQFPTFASGISSLSKGASTTASGATSFADGVKTWASGAKETASGSTSLAQGAQSLSAGVDATATGASELASGANELTSGISTLHREVQKMPDEVQSEIDSMMAEYDKSDFVPPSFTSPRNVNVSLVQFVFSTQPIERPPAEEPEPTEEPQSFWDRLLGLFQ